MKQGKKKQISAQQWSLWIVLAVLVLMVAAVSYYYSPGRGGNAQTDIAYPAPVAGGSSQVEEVKLGESPVMEIALSGPAADPSAEFSGLAWFGDNLILLPQYPNIFDENGDGLLFYLPKDELKIYIGGAQGAPLELRSIKLIAPDLTDQIRDYQGFESIGFSGDQAFLTIEAWTGTDMHGYLISGTMSADLSTLTLDTTKLTEIPTQAKSDNHSDESMLVMKDKVITFYEVNGTAIVSNPVAHVFDFDLNPQGTIPMDNLEYRLTDTALSAEDKFWGINYLFPGDTDLLPQNEPILEKFGTGETHAKHPQVERLVQFLYSDSKIIVSGRPPVYLQLTEDIRNWEGLVVLDDYGVLMVTDKYPRTILAFVRVR